MEALPAGLPAARMLHHLIPQAMKTTPTSDKTKQPPFSKRTKHVRRTTGPGSIFEPLAGEKDQDYLPMMAPSAGTPPRHDFGRPGW